ncbi:MAG: hypothetical protein ACERKK_12450 [Poseidonibacter sp.]|uniref:hypothetical protein n=1 Tax=Poseidonibacter sp. TaxID=2321188 RepID=UPI00359E8DA8
MRRGLRQSIIINNFFTLASIIIITVTLVLYTKYIQPSKTTKEKVEKKVERLSCQNDNYSTAILFNQKLLNDSIKALNNGYYKLHGGYVKSIYSKSIIEDFISIDELNAYFKNAIKSNPKKDIKKFLLINYDIIEYDKNDVKNKKQNRGFYSGSILTSFRVNGNEIFRFNSDFKFYDKNEIKSTIDCAIKVYKNHVQKL